MSAAVRKGRASPGREWRKYARLFKAGAREICAKIMGRKKRPAGEKGAQKRPLCIFFIVWESLHQHIRACHRDIR